MKPGWLTNIEEVPGRTVSIDKANTLARESWRGGFRSGVAFTIGAALAALLVRWAFA